MQQTTATATPPVPASPGPLPAPRSAPPLPPARSLARTSAICLALGLTLWGARSYYRPYSVPELVAGYDVSLSGADVRVAGRVRRIERMASAGSTSPRAFYCLTLFDGDPATPCEVECFWLVGDQVKGLTPGDRVTATGTVGLRTGGGRVCLSSVDLSR